MYTVDHAYINEPIETGSYNTVVFKQSSLHCKEDPIYVFPEVKLRDLVPNLHMHVSVSDLYIFTICPPIFDAK